MEICEAVQEAYQWTGATVTGGALYAIKGAAELVIGKLSRLWDEEVGKKWEIQGVRSGAKMVNFWAHFAFPGRLASPCRNIIKAATFEKKQDQKLAEKYASKVREIQMEKTKWGIWLPNDLIVVYDDYMDGTEPFESGITEGICSGMVLEFARMALGKNASGVIESAQKLDSNEKQIAKAAACQAAMDAIGQLGSMRHRTVILPVLNGLISQMHVGQVEKGILNADLHQVVSHFAEYHSRIKELSFPEKPLKRLSAEQDYNTGQLLRCLVRMNEGSIGDIDHPELYCRVVYLKRESAWFARWNALIEARGMRIEPMDHKVGSAGAQNSDEDFYQNFVRADLEPGIYYVGLEVDDGGHATAYAKLDDEHGYLFDPNIGLIECFDAQDTVEQMRKMMDFYSDVSEKREKGLPPLEEGERRHFIRMCRFLKN